jgi:hypothetical protein
MEQEEPLINNPNIDKITLELFMNRNIYKKYVAKNEPEKHEKLLEHYGNIKKYRHRIIELTKQLLDDPTLQITTETNEIFDAYSRILVRHFQQKDMETNQLEDVMFDPEAMEESPAVEQVQVFNQSSFWGKERVVKSQTTISQYDMNMLQRRNK